MKPHPFVVPFLPAAAAPALMARQHALRRRAILAVDQPHGLRVACGSGCLWLTFDGCQQDYVLEAGNALQCREPGRLLVAALEDSTFTLD